MKTLIIGFLFVVSFAASAQSDTLLKAKAPVCGLEPPSSPKVFIRCGGTLSYTEPLLVVDGVVADKDELKNISPDDIQSITILNDKTASAIYGYRASNGVIVVTTKNANRRSLIITDETDGSPIAGATVTVYSGDDSTLTSSAEDGKVVLTDVWSKKAVSFRVSSVGYDAAFAKLKWKRASDLPVIMLKRKNNLLQDLEIKTIAGRRIGCGSMCVLYCKVAGCFIRVDSTATSTSKNCFSTRIYPNPASASSPIQINTSGGFISSAQLLNASGQLMSTTQYKGKQSSIQFQLPQVPAGVYFVRLTTAANQLLQTHKLVIQ